MPEHEPAVTFIQRREHAFDPDSAELSCTLPSDWYYDPGIFEKEHEAIFYKTWWYQGHVSDVLKPGDYVCGSVADQECFIIRDEEGRLRAFYNVCSHRAHPLLEAQGNVRRIVCPYHQWCYRPDGRFERARGVEGSGMEPRGNANLKPIRVETYGGFLFVNLDPDATSLKQQASGLLKDIEDNCPRLNELVHARRYERDVAANWKTLLDNNHECYHCSINHKSLMNWVDYGKSAIWKQDGITFTHSVMPAPRDSAPFQKDDEAAAQESLFAFIWPTTIPLMFPGSPSVLMFQIIPAGPETSRIRHDFYFLHKTPSEQEEQYMTWVTEVLAAEDVGLCESVQKGLHSRGYHQGRFVVNRDQVDISEHHVHWCQSLIYKALTA